MSCPPNHHSCQHRPWNRGNLLDGRTALARPRFQAPRNRPPHVRLLAASGGGWTARPPQLDDDYRREAECATEPGPAVAVIAKVAAPPPSSRISTTMKRIVPSKSAPPFPRCDASLKQVRWHRDGLPVKATAEGTAGSCRTKFQMRVHAVMARTSCLCEELRRLAGSRRPRCRQ
jgi:hypothetical protein